ncbi:competence protein ComFB [Paenibacillus psychroresistens]|uniref:Competence protein ComFB n=1 Tax=Paenibacillus psychroresistens TaxID=1778678 RepID=A0A6B8RHP5_9BACL|nr:late competence development ComFB family protein [Paenibacillus psychroresistens]QGQ95760.1 competence protein ComFB [Paenibacillus psychroresistens]
MEVHNLMEDIVKNCLKELMNHNNRAAEIDEKNQSDILAITLNKLPSKYVATSQGEMLAKTQLRSQVETDVYRELSLAMDIVLKSSRNSVFDEKNG